MPVLMGWIHLLQEMVVVGSAAHSDIRVEGPHVGAEHAQIAQKRGGVFCTALQGDEDDLTSSTHTWIDGCEIRRGAATLSIMICRCTAKGHQISVHATT